jgi:hypothetical protein
MHMRRAHGAGRKSGGSGGSGGSVAPGMAGLSLVDLARRITEVEEELAGLLAAMQAAIQAKGGRP